MGRFDLNAGTVSLQTLLDFASAAQRIGAGIDTGPMLTRPYIAGVEVTQGIQYFWADQHLTNANDRGPDNSVGLVARKPAWVRVYVRSGLLGDSQNLTGEVVVEHRTGALLGDWTQVGILTPQPPGSVTSERNPAYVTERGSIGSTLNFIAGADLMEGFVRFTARIWRAGDATHTPINIWQETVDATLLQTLSLRGLFVHYNGPDPTINATNPPTVDLPAPTLANLQATAAWTLTTNPVEKNAVFSSAGQMNWFSPLTGPATVTGGCSTEWQALTYWLSLLKLNDGNRGDVIYYGLLPAAMPIGTVGGCELNGVSAGPDTRQQIMAHEVGHGAGLQHAPCNVTGPTVDASYQAYEPYDPKNVATASLGEYGLDITNGSIHAPSEKDYMGYCGPPVWISLYHHARLFGNDKFNPRRVGVQHWTPPDLVDPYLWPWEYIPDPPNWDGRPGYVRVQAEPLIAMVGVVGETRAVEVSSVMRVQALRGATAPTSTPYVAQLVGARGNIVASAPVARLPAQGGGCGCGCNGTAASSEGPFVFQALVPDVEPGSELRIVKRADEDGESETVWTRPAPSRPPRVGSFAVTVSRGLGRATWEARAARECALDFSLQLSKDGGRSWNSLAVGITTTEHRFPSATLPSGRLIFRVLAHDGFHSATRTSRPVVVPRRPPIVSILSPQAGRPFFAGSPVRLWGAVTEDDGAPVDPQVCSWLLDDRPVARGTDGWIVAPAPGDHRCTFIVRGRGGTARAEVTLRTLDPSETDPRRLRGQSEPTTVARRASLRRGRSPGRGGGKRRR
jgi:hypothetical protein